MDLMTITKHLQRVALDNSPAILTAIGVSGVIGTAVLASKATFQAADELDFIGKGNPNGIQLLTKKEIFQRSWKFYIPAAIVGTVSVAAIIGSHSISTRRNAAIMSAFSVLESASREYRERVIEQIGIQKEERIREAVAENHIQNNPVSNSQVIVTGGGDDLCYDTLSGRYFKSSVEKIKRAQNEVNSECLSSMYASQNDFYRKVGLDAIVFGEELGWSFDNLMDIQFTTHLSSDDRPCLALEYRVAPIRGYHKVNR